MIIINHNRENINGGSDNFVVNCVLIKSNQFLKILTKASVFIEDKVECKNIGIISSKIYIGERLKVKALSVCKNSKKLLMTGYRSLRDAKPT